MRGRRGRRPSPEFGAGQFGVDLFFCLSAYLITELLMREKAATGRVDVSAFYIRRALRIWPLYFAFLAASYLVGPPVPGFYYAEARCLSATLLFI
jgi:peptidoglycan/LPS O-acetylase OafA/YrhL